jgi:hypothetical protein
MKRQKYVRTFEEHSSELNISGVSDSFIDSVSHITYTLCYRYVKFTIMKNLWSKFYNH